MKKFNRYFGGEYLKYWYAAFVVVVGIMAFNFYNSRAVDGYILTVYDKGGNILQEKKITRTELSRGGLYPEITKSYRPVKKF